MMTTSSLTGLAALLLVAAPVQGLGQAPRYDVVIAGGTVIDGTGRARYAADVAVRGGRVVLVSRRSIPAAWADRVVDARGLIVAPGFIDLHAHLEPLPQMPDAESHVRQGVTLALGGPDGGGPSPFGEYLAGFRDGTLGMNVAFLTGHNTIRRRVMGTANRAPDRAELERMRAMVTAAMRAGAFGLSTGLRYVPGVYSSTDEVVTLARAAAAGGGIYTSHLREEGVGLFEGVAEALEIGRRARIPVVLTHHKVVGPLMWGKSVTTLAMVDSARRARTDVMIDQYPYTATSTSLDVLVPPWALAEGDSALRRRMAVPMLRDSILRGVTELLETDRGGGDLRRVQFARVAWDSTLDGRTLHDLVLRKGIATTAAAAAPVVVEAVLAGGASMVYHVLDEGDVRRIMAHPMTMIASDGRLSAPGPGIPHPRAYGTFPRVLGKYVREDSVLSLETAVRKMTAMPAARLGLRDRGCLRAGCVADVTVFDAGTVHEAGTFSDPHRYPGGIRFVFVNGVAVVDAGRFTTARPGRVVRRR